MLGGSDRMKRGKSRDSARRMADHRLCKAAEYAAAACLLRRSGVTSALYFCTSRGYIIVVFLELPRIPNQRDHPLNHHRCAYPSRRPFWYRISHHPLTALRRPPTSPPPFFLFWGDSSWSGNPSMFHNLQLLAFHHC